jgi:hypothetical protein
MSYQYQNSQPNYQGQPVYPPPTQQYNNGGAYMQPTPNYANANAQVNDNKQEQSAVSSVLSCLPNDLLIIHVFMHVV